MSTKPNSTCPNCSDPLRSWYSLSREEAIAQCVNDECVLTAIVDDQETFKTEPYEFETPKNNPVAGDNPYALSERERFILSKLVEAWNTFTEDQANHSDDEQAEFRHGIHALQDMIMARPTVRALRDEAKTP